MISYNCELAKRRSIKPITAHCIPLYIDSKTSLISVLYPSAQGLLSKQSFVMRQTIRTIRSDCVHGQTWNPITNCSYGLSNKSESRCSVLGWNIFMFAHLAVFIVISISIVEFVHEPAKSGQRETISPRLSILPSFLPSFLNPPLSACACSGFCPSACADHMYSPPAARRTLPASAARANHSRAAAGSDGQFSKPASHMAAAHPPFCRPPSLCLSQLHAKSIASSANSEEMRRALRKGT